VFHLWKVHLIIEFHETALKLYGKMLEA